ncbi:serine/threonine-protein kinase Nek8-like [Callorhinchus milii]|uniref:serine/threonine-protein kinase Nek8-like n=1 Tax=Callorhinchus milii TaxID=7868 RepID=UPI00045756CB|nr:serine/threonine-protein kinase Nek8-like [Callorhinchus milii]|eukprot:gi/632939141/ref/XP_007907859.1/ PREDICTED: serine/threonine-protein kinase Nek8-like [Callorhinchus milii]
MQLNKYSVPVSMARDVLGSELQAAPDQDGTKLHILDLYCDKLKQPHSQTLAEFEKIHTVGKGAYGTAVLYRKKDDDSLVILKEINMHELNHIERQRAMNEVKVLSMLDHPNIISYYDSFEEEGLLMIEMEYADGGTLAQYLAQQDGELEERDILNLFHQMVAAISYLHEHNVLHRDLKTANIFLTKDSEVKLGDFGVAKVMSTGSEAHTILGTPYYISPEICEGKCYNEKSDIWSLGCILYEMACRRRTFEGTNLPAVVNKIMKGQFAPITDRYSPELKALVTDMLQKEPQYRPAAHELLYVRIPEALVKYKETPDEEAGAGISDPQPHPNHKRNRRSALYHLHVPDLELCPIEGFPTKIRITQVAVSDGHTVAVGMERAVYTWGRNRKGQLGHGDLQSRSRPQLVDALKGKAIVRACCGDVFSVFLSDNGIVMTCGDGSQGCLGHGDLCSTSRPCLIEALLSVNVQDIACGLQHVVCVDGDGEVFSWGNGRHGKLGLGNEDDHCVPVKVAFEEQVFIRDVRSGSDGTMFLTDTGSVLACGNNQYNKLGLNERRGLLMQMTTLFARTDVEGRKVPTIVKALRHHRVRDAVLGPSHSIVLVEPGLLFTFGKNTEGQLGTANTKAYKVPVHVKELQDKTLTTLGCGETFSVVGADDNSILFWGTKHRSAGSTDQLGLTAVNQAATEVAGAPVCPPKAEEPSVRPGNSTARNKDTDSENHKKEQVGTSLGKESKQAGEGNLDAQESSSLIPAAQRVSKPDSLEEHVTYMNSMSVKDPMETRLANCKSESKDVRDLGRSKVFGSQISFQDREAIQQLVPTLLVSLKQVLQESSDTHAPTLRTVICNKENIFVLVEHSLPLSHKRVRKHRNFRRRGGREYTEQQLGHNLHYSHSSNDAGDEYTSSEMSELETGRLMPTWIRNELSDAAPIEVGTVPQGNEPELIAGEDRGRVKEVEAAGVVESTEAVVSTESNAATKELEMSSTSAVRAHGRKLPEATCKSGILRTKVTGSHRAHTRLRSERGHSKSTGPWVSSPPSSVNTSKHFHHPALTESSLSKNKNTDLSRVAKQVLEGKQREEESIQQQEEKQKSLEVLHEQQRSAMERETRLQMEIDGLYKELKEQKQLLKHNSDVMQQLQEQLLKVQSQQFRTSSRAEREQSNHKSHRTAAKAESRVCAVM